MDKRVCPHWLGYWLANPLRKLFQNPEEILGSYITNGMTVLDIGPAMGFFTLPMARMVGPKGKVVCVDVQEQMLESLQKRAQKSQLSERIMTRVCPADSLGVDDLNGKIDFALAFAVVHEIPDIPNLFAQISKVLKPGASCLVAEPKGHVTITDFQQILAIIKQNGLSIVKQPSIAFSHTALIKKDY